MAPLPTVSGVARVSFTWSDGISTFGSRIFISTADPGASSDDMTSLADQVEALYADTINPQVSEAFTLQSVEAVDLTSDTGNDGFWIGSLAGGRAGGECPSNVSQDLRLHIAPRYRGGHPVVHFPPSISGDLSSPRQWDDAWVTAFNAAGADFLTGINELTIGSFPPCTWMVLRGYRPGALPEAVTPWPVLATALRPYVGTMRRRARSLR